MPSQDLRPQLRVLIADDSAVVRDSLTRLLDGVEAVEVVGQAQDAADAVDASQDLRPDVVILDLRMPGGSGLDAIERLQQADWTPRIIVLTNYPFLQYRRRCLAAGASFFLDKSTEFHWLPWALEQLRHETDDQDR
jgi:DNA-binding NarL/FixJ family response regulator